MSKPIKIYDETFTARNFLASPVTISDLLGDTYDYHIMIKSDDVSTDSNIRLRFNGDTGGNYSNYYMLGALSTALASVSPIETSTQLNNGFANSAVNGGLIILSITGVSGSARHTKAIFTGNSRISVNASYWNNTANEITSIEISGGSSATVDAHIIIYRTLKEASNDWEFISKLSWSAESIEKSFTGLLGDTDKVYRLEWDGSQELNIELNNDTTTYARQYMQNTGGTLSSANSTSQSSIVTDGIRSTVIINAVTGHKRLAVTSASNTVSAQQSERGHWYDETATEITTIDCTPTASATGTAKLYRQKKKGNGFFNLPFKLVKEVAVSGDFSAGHTFSGLLGDSTKLYKVSGLFSTVGNDLRMQLNNNTGSVYFHQSLTNSSASSSTTTFALLCSASVSKVASFELYIYPLSGETRPCLLRVVRGENTIEFKTFVYNQSATELTDIKIFASSTGTCTGNLKLYKLG